MQWLELRTLHLPLGAGSLLELRGPMYTVTSSYRCFVTLLLPVIPKELVGSLVTPLNSNCLHLYGETLKLALHVLNHVKYPPGERDHPSYSNV